MVKPLFLLGGSGERSGTARKNYTMKPPFGNKGEGQIGRVRMSTAFLHFLIRLSTFLLFSQTIPDLLPIPFEHLFVDEDCF